MAVTAHVKGFFNDQAFINSLKFIFNLVGTPVIPGNPGNPGSHGIPGAVGQKGDKGRVLIALLNVYLEL